MDKTTITMLEGMYDPARMCVIYHGLHHSLNLLSPAVTLLAETELILTYLCIRQRSTHHTPHPQCSRVNSNTIKSAAPLIFYKFEHQKLINSPILQAYISKRGTGEVLVWIIF